MRFFRPRWIWGLPLRRLLLSPRVITIYPCIVTGYDIGNEVGVVAGLLFEFVADSNAMGLLVVVSSLGANLTKLCCMFKLSATGNWTVLYDSPTISQTSWIVCLWSARIASRTFAMFSSVLLVDCHPERSSSSTHVCLSSKRLNNKKVLLWLTTLSLKASCSIWWISAAVL
jgi:hypothetical protein